MDKPTTAISAIRLKCIDCMGGQLGEVTKCKQKTCTCYAWKSGKRKKEDVNEHSQKSSLRTIKAKCLDCCLDSHHEVTLCTAEKCPLWEFRKGKNPYKKELSEEKKQALRERMQKVHSQRNIE